MKYKKNEISFCTNDDFPILQKFIHEVWKENHILSVDKELFNFQHQSRNGYNFVISKNENNQIIGALGFIPLYKYDKNLTETKDIWGAIWIVDNSKSEPGTGFSLLEWLEKKIQPDSIGAIGINVNVKRIYEILGYKTGSLNQFYILNTKVKNFKIARNISNERLKSSCKLTTILKEISLDDIDDLNFTSSPLKSKDYLGNRYFKHPYYDYLLFGAYNGDSLVAVFIVRKIEVNNSSCLRIIDIQGNINNVGSIYESILTILKEHDSEYLDCLNYGISEEVFSNWGFSLRNSETVIPNYFEPFVQKNIDILFAFKAKKSDYIIFKGDSDQDRPNILK